MRAVHEQTSPVYRLMPLALFALVLVSFFATLPQVVSTWEGVKESYGDQDFGLRVARELVLILILAIAMLRREFWTIVLAPRTATLIAIIATYVCFEIAHAVHLGYPLIVPLTGLRVFEYAPLIVVGVMLASHTHGQSFVSRFAWYLRFYVVIQGGLAVVQALWAPPLHGVSSLGGGLAFGSFVAPNLYGVTMATCALVFAVAGERRFRKWIWIAGLAAVLSGSRTAILHITLVLGWVTCLRLRPRDRWLIGLPAPIIAIATLHLASLQAVSGREIDLSQEGRLGVWHDVIDGNLQSWSEFLFGWGLGLGSNTINVLFGLEHFVGQFVSDSFYLFLLNGYGAVGLLGYLLLLWASWRVSAHPFRGLVMTFIFCAGLPFNVWEYFPQNALLMLLWGIVLGTRRQHALAATDAPTWEQPGACAWRAEAAS